MVTTIITIESAVFAQEYDPKWGFGIDVGMLTGTIDSTVFAFGANVDYYLTEDFSVGPMVQIAPGSALTQVNSWAVAKLHFKSRYVDFAPFTGPGLTWARVGAGRLSPKSDDDASLSMVLGAEFSLGKIGNYAIAASVMYSAYKLNFGPHSEQGDGAFMLGVRF